MGECATDADLDVVRTGLDEYLCDPVQLDPAQRPMQDAYMTNTRFRHAVEVSTVALAAVVAVLREEGNPQVVAAMLVRSTWPGLLADLLAAYTPTPASPYPFGPYPVRIGSYRDRPPRSGEVPAGGWVEPDDEPGYRGGIHP